MPFKLTPDDRLSGHFNPYNGNMILQQKMAKACSVLWIGTIIDNMIVEKAKVVFCTNEFTEVPKYAIIRTAKL